MSPPRAAAAAVLAALALSCDRAHPTAETIVLVTLDTTRADRLGCYGYAGARTPNLDRLAAESAVFEDATATAPVTLPSHASMFTGQYPAVHGVRYNGMFRLSDSSTTVAEILSAASWTTAAVPAAFPVSRRTGIAQGFQVYLDLFEEEGAASLPPSAERNAEEVTGLALKLLSESAGKRRLLWLHYYDPHFVYQPPFPFSAEFRDRPYDGEIAYMDREIGRLLDTLRDSPAWERTAVIVAGDHGEGLYDHGEKMHANLAYQSTMRVPLIVKPPGRGAPRRIQEPVSLVDVAPTILELAGVRPPGDMQGISLAPAIRGAAVVRRTLHFETLAGSLVYGWSPLEGVRRGSWKYTRSTEPELFDLSSDPSEEANRFAGDRGVADDLESVLAGDLAAFQKSAAPASSTAAPVDQESLDRLASLGYVGGSLSAEARGGPHPRKFVHLESEIFNGRNFMDARAFAEALRIWELVLREDPRNRFALTQATIAARRLRASEAAAGFARRLIDAYPESPDGWTFLGEVWVEAKELERAYAAFADGLAQHGSDSGLLYRAALASIATNRFDTAATLIDRGVASGRDAASFALARAHLLAKQGRAGEALAALREAVAGGYDDREVLRSEPMLEPLRRIPGFDEIVAAIPDGKRAP